MKSSPGLRSTCSRFTPSAHLVLGSNPSSPAAKRLACSAGGTALGSDFCRLYGRISASTRPRARTPFIDDLEAIERLQRRLRGGPRPLGRMASGAVVGHQHTPAAVGGVRGTRLFRAGRVHRGIPVLVRRHAASLPDAATGGRRLRVKARRSYVPLAAGHLGKEVLHRFEPGYRQHPELH